MKFHRQFEVPQRDVKPKDKGISLTVPNQALPLRKVVERYNNGNIFGLSSFNVTYDSDYQYWDENHVILLDRADPLTAIQELKAHEKEVSSSLKRAAERIAAEKAASEKVIEK